MKPQPPGVQGMQPWNESATEDGAPPVDDDSVRRRRDPLGGGGGAGQRVSLRGDDSRSDRLPLPSLRAETGAVLERQLLLSGSPPEGSDVRAGSSWTIRLGILVVVAALAGCAVVLYNHMERKWHAQVSELRDDVARLEQERHRVRRENEEKTRILVAKVRENEKLSAVATQTLNRLNETMRELRKEPPAPRAPTEEATSGLNIQSVLADAVKQLCRVFPAETGSDP